MFGVNLTTFLLWNMYTISETSEYIKVTICMICTYIFLNMCVPEFAFKVNVLGSTVG